MRGGERAVRTRVRQVQQWILGGRANGCPVPNQPKFNCLGLARRAADPGPFRILFGRPGAAQEMAGKAGDRDSRHETRHASVSVFFP
jgi:hypothetical protein